jgi:hypothetical protein
MYAKTSGRGTLRYCGNLMNLRDSNTPQINAVTRLFNMSCRSSRCPVMTASADETTLQKYNIFLVPQKNICGDKILFLSLQNKTTDTMPTILTLFGLRFFFYSEEHLPMHVHIQNADGKAKIAINPDVVLVENNGIKPHDIKRALEITRMYQNEFIKAWEEYHGE